MSGPELFVITEFHCITFWKGLIQQFLHLYAINSNLHPGWLRTNSLRQILSVLFRLAVSTLTTGKWCSRVTYFRLCRTTRSPFSTTTSRSGISDRKRRTSFRPKRVSLTITIMTILKLSRSGEIVFEIQLGGYSVLARLEANWVRARF